MHNRISCLLLVIWLVATVHQTTEAQGFGRGNRGRGGRQGPDDRHQADQQVFQFLLQNHSRITRTVKELPNGVETVTESSDPGIADKIKEHVKWMAYRVEEIHPIRMRDPLFAELFRHADKIRMNYQKTEKGVKVVETSDDPYVVGLIQAHANVVSKFVERGFAEAMKNHKVPDRPGSKKTQGTAPVIKDHGGVIPMPQAAQQPRDGTRVLIDITRGSQPDQLNPAIEQVARYLNIYATAGKEPATADFAIVVHGDATLAVLNPDAYGSEFGTAGNPNAELLMKLHEAGVQIFVCGQSLHAKGRGPDDLLVFVETAVSAFTACVNLQSDGYAYIPLGK
jgi:intracellular sulfur oxidation DsrE/DsrF family protein